MTALDYMNRHKMLKTVKFMSLEEYRQNYFCSYDSHAVLFLHEKYGYKVDVAHTILESLYALEDRQYGYEKLDRLVGIKNELQKQEFIEYNPLFHNYLKTVKTVVYGYGKLSDFDKKIINGEVVEYQLQKRDFEVNEFGNMEEEIEYLYNSIADLLMKGIDINHIFVMNMTEENEPYIKRFSRYYQINIDYGKAESIIGTPLAREYLSWLDEYDHQTIYDKLQAYKDNPIYGKLVNLLNKYIEFDLKRVKDLIHHDLLASKVDSPIRFNVVKNIAMFTPLNTDDHVFLLNFNDQFPKMKRDTDLISDNLKPLVGLADSEQENLLIKQNTIAYLSGIRNLHLSYSKNSPFNEYGPSTLLDEVTYITPAPSYEYSEEFNKVRLSYRLEDYRKYRTESDELKKLHYNYGDGGYLSYNNEFSGLNDRQISEMKPPVLSYSSMDKYYKCAYRYYLDKQLHIDPNDSNFMARLGTFFHAILEMAFTDGFDFDNAYEEYLRNNRVCENNREEFFCRKLKEDLRLVIETIREHKQHSLLKDELNEQQVDWYDQNEKAFTGKIDKIAYCKGSNGTLIAIIDYKTGSIEFNLNMIEYGLSMQLPCYLFLSRHLKRNLIGDPADFQYVGFYLQHLITDSAKIDGETSAQQQKRENLKLDGYSTNNVGRFKLFDDTIAAGEKSTFVKKMKLNNDESVDKRSSWIIDDEWIQRLADLAEQKIREAREHIRNGDFAINPKWLKSKNVSCRYCPYLDICFRREKNYCNPENSDISDDEEDREVEADE